MGEREKRVIREKVGRERERKKMERGWRTEGIDKREGTERKKG
jgi:hypothetical protein